MMTYWMYITMVRPIVSYPALIWWSRIKKKVCMNELSKLQRTACISIMGAFRTTPTAALELAIGLTPLLFGSRERPELRTSQFATLVMLPKEVTLHIRISVGEIVLENMFNMQTDTVIPRYSFAKKFTVTYPDRSEWKKRNVQSLSKGPVWCTD